MMPVKNGFATLLCNDCRETREEPPRGKYSASRCNGCSSAYPNMAYCVRHAIQLVVCQSCGADVGAAREQELRFRADFLNRSAKPGFRNSHNR